MKKLLNKPVRKKSKFRSWTAKSPLLAGLAVLAGLVALGGASYGVYYGVTNQTSSIDETDKIATVANANKAQPVEKIADIDKDVKEVKKKTTTQDISEPEQYKRNEDGITPMTGGGCAGIACYSLGGFSIVASPKTVTLHAGESSGPILIKTTNGSKVDWGGMPEDGYDIAKGKYGVGSFAQTFPGSSKSFEYYASAHEQASPGTYHLEFYATKEANKQWAKTTVTVRVVP